MTQELSKRGIDAYQGATQLNFVPSDASLHRTATHKESTNNLPPSSFILEKSIPLKTSFKQSKIMKEATETIIDDANVFHDKQGLTQAEFLINHVVYLPINKTVPFTQIDRICGVLSEVLAQYNIISHQSTNSEELSKIPSFKNVSYQHENDSQAPSKPHEDVMKCDLGPCFKKAQFTADNHFKSEISHESYKKSSCEDKSYDNDSLTGVSDELCNIVSDALVNGKFSNKCKM